MQQRLGSLNGADWPHGFGSAFGHRSVKQRHDRIRSTRVALMRHRRRRCLTATPPALIGTCVGALARPNVMTNLPTDRCPINSDIHSTHSRANPKMSQDVRVPGRELSAPGIRRRAALFVAASIVRPEPEVRYRLDGQDILGQVGDVLGRVPANRTDRGSATSLGFPIGHRRIWHRERLREQPRLVPAIAVMDVAHRCLNVGVAHPRLDRRHLGLAHGQRSERVPEVRGTGATEVPRARERPCPVPERAGVHESR